MGNQHQAGATGRARSTRALRHAPNIVDVPSVESTIDPSRYISSLAEKQKVKCPSCKSVLITPREAVFSCPCGQMLVRPGDQPILSKGDTLGDLLSMRVRCPRCLSMCDMPAGTIVIPCSCGLHLRHPGSQAQQSEGGDGLTNASASLPGASSLYQWRRRPVTREKLGWRRVWSEQEIIGIADAEERVLLGVRQEFETEKLGEDQLRQRLAKCLIETSARQSREELIEIACRGPEHLVSQFSTVVLRNLLDDRLLDHSSCVTHLELAQRLFAFEWSQRESAKLSIDRTRSAGFVRSFQPKADGGTFLDSRDAYSFLISTRMGMETLAEPASVSSDEILQVVTFPFKEKIEWVQEHIKNLRTPWEQGHVRVRVRRSHLLEDSFNAFLRLEPSDMQRFFRFEFIEEPGQDAGGVAREWFDLVVESCFDLDLGLFTIGETGNICYQIAAFDATLAPEEVDLRLKYFRFLGRVLGKAIFDGHHVAAHFTRVLYKHFLAWPITEEDIESIDEDVANSTKAIRECSDLSELCLDFTITFAQSFGGTPQTVELVPGGSCVEVTNENREEYLQLRLKHLALHRIATPLQVLLIGLYETIPFALLSVFDYAELELLLCGLPDIDLEDWKQYTVYKGEYEALGGEHSVIKMFWEALAEASSADRARFLQFSTGTSRVPVQGFSLLQGVDGATKQFTIESIPLEQSVFPHAHTCFNRVQLPLYKTKEELKFRLGQALNLEGIGFEQE